MNNPTLGPQRQAACLPNWETRKLGGVALYSWVCKGLACVYLVANRFKHPKRNETSKKLGEKCLGKIWEFFGNELCRTAKKWRWVFMDKGTLEHQFCTFFTTTGIVQFLCHLPFSCSPPTWSTSRKWSVFDKELGRTNPNLRYSFPRLIQLGSLSAFLPIYAGFQTIQVLFAENTFWILVLVAPHRCKERLLVWRCDVRLSVCLFVASNLWVNKARHNASKHSCFSPKRSRFELCGDACAFDHIYGCVGLCTYHSPVTQDNNKTVSRTRPLLLGWIGHGSEGAMIIKPYFFIQIDLIVFLGILISIWIGLCVMLCVLVLHSHRFFFQ